MTARAESAERARKRRELERDYKVRAREQLAALRAHLKHARKWRAARRRKVREACKHGRELARAHAQIIRAEHKAEAVRQIELERRTAAAQCASRMEGAEHKARTAIDRAALKLGAELSYQRSLAAYAEKPRKQSRVGERRAESDSEVEHNIPHELIPVWRRVKPKILATARRTRTEAFAEWAHEHQAEVRAILDAEVEASIEHLIEHEAEQRAALGEDIGRWSDERLIDRHARASSYPAEAPF